MRWGHWLHCGIRSSLLACGLIATMGALGAEPASAQVIGGKSYALVGIQNDSVSTVTYWYRWGEAGWSRKTLRPGRSWWHSWDPADAAPAFRVAYRDGAGRWVHHRLSHRAAPFELFELSKHYGFQTVIGGHGGVRLIATD